MFGPDDIQSGHLKQDVATAKLTWAKLTTSRGSLDTTVSVATQRTPHTDLLCCKCLKCIHSLRLLVQIPGAKLLDILSHFDPLLVFLCPSFAVLSKRMKGCGILGTFWLLVQIPGASQLSVKVSLSKTPDPNHTQHFKQPLVCKALNKCLPFTLRTMCH